MKTDVKKLLSLILILTFMIPVLACSEKPTATDNTAEPSEVESDAETGAARDTRFDGVDYEGRDFRVYTSADSYDATNANEMIEGSGQLNGDVVNDAVFNRNAAVMELLNINLVFTQSMLTYVNAEAEIRKMIMAASDDYDVMINDVRSFAALTDENMFINIADAENFDYSQKYWYTAAMEDLQIIPGMSYIMAGDYFMDVIASCHSLFYNKNITDSYYGDPDYIYDLVLKGTWTYENMTKIVEETYADLNGDSEANEGDQFGLSICDTWGAVLPFIGSAGIKFVDRSSGEPVFAFNNERSITYLEALSKLIWNKGTLTTVTDRADLAASLRNLFSAGLTVTVGYNRLGDLKKMRDITGFEIGVIPYPKLLETDHYITSIHDTTEMGVIPVTSQDTDFVTTVLEVLSRETSVMLMPQYYETALKVKYITDSLSATMIDIIHDNFGSSFPLAYDNSLNGIMLHSFSDPLTEKSTDFASTYAKLENVANTNLNKMIEAILENNG
ncbi:MAG: type 2 periplasmic-binding domain-containing protein [Eubacteriales bacterium]